MSFKLFLLGLTLVNFGCSSQEKHKNVKAEEDPDLVRWTVDGRLDKLKGVLGLSRRLNDGNGNRVTLLMLAAYRDRDEIVQYFLSQGADCNIRDDAGQTAVHYAALSPKGAAMPWLLGAGCESNIKDTYGLTPLMQAVRHGSPQAIATLANPETLEAKATDGWTPIFFAVVRGRNEVIQLLLDLGANCLVQDEAGDTPLHLAVELGDSGLVGQIIRRCNNGSKNGRGLTALDLARQKQKNDLAQILGKSTGR